MAGKTPVARSHRIVNHNETEPNDEKESEQVPV